MSDDSYVPVFTCDPSFINLCPELLRAALGLLNWTAAELAKVSDIPEGRLGRYCRGDLASLGEDEQYHLVAGFCGTLAFTLRGELKKGVRFADTPLALLSLAAGIDLRPSGPWKANFAVFRPFQDEVRRRDGGKPT